MSLLRNSYRFSYHFSLLIHFKNNDSFNKLTTYLTTIACNQKNALSISFSSSLKILNNRDSFINFKQFSIDTSMDERTYENIANETLDLLTEKLENIIEKVDPISSDIVFNNGVITLSLGSKGTFVINKQTPNRQIWLSSPLSGPKRYDYIDKNWIYKHDGQSLEELLKIELEELYQTTVDL